MNATIAQTQTLIVERVLPHAPEKIWRALTESALIGEWLMANDFAPVVGHRFHLRAPATPHWNGVVACEVRAVDPPSHLSYTWDGTGDEASPLRTVVTWTLTPVRGGTLVRMEQSGFRQGDVRNYQGAAYGWQKFMDGLERACAALA